MTVPESARQQAAPWGGVRPGVLVLSVLCSAAGYEPARQVVDVPAREANDPRGALRCTYYRDWMIRETGVDTPGPAAAELVALSPGAARDCEHAPGSRLPSTAGHTLIGRVDALLVFRATDPNGAVPFIVLDAPSGAIRFEDAYVGADPMILRHAAGRLSLRYTRGINAPCSLAVDGAACWNELLRRGALPAQMANERPRPEDCATVYRTSAVALDSPTLVTYPVRVTFGSHRATITSREGSVRCHLVP